MILTNTQRYRLDTYNEYVSMTEWNGRADISNMDIQRINRYDMLDMWNVLASASIYPDLTDWEYEKFLIHWELRKTH